MLLLSFRVEPGTLEWFDGQGDNPMTAKALKAGPMGTVEAVIAHHADVRDVVKEGGRLLAQRAERRLARHRDTGNSRIELKLSPPLALDAEVSLVDPEKVGDGGTVRDRTRKRSALSIEFGWFNRRTGARAGGLYILTGAAEQMAKHPNRRLG